MRDFLEHSQTGKAVKGGSIYQLVFGNNHSSVRNNRGESNLAVLCEVMDPLALKKDSPLMQKFDFAFVHLPAAVANAWINWLNPDLTGNNTGSDQSGTGAGNSSKEPGTPAMAPVSTTLAKCLATPTPIPLVTPGAATLTPTKHHMVTLGTATPPQNS
jgi:hypothetical protein